MTAPMAALEVGTLRIAGSLRPPLLSRDSGPGLRWLLFLQGCARPCTDQCLNPHYLDSRGGRLADSTELRLVAGQVAAGTWGRAEGVTLLGGEPTDQAAALYPFLQTVRSLGLSVMLYSGHPLSWFFRPENAAARALLAWTDIVVDGPFLPHLADPGLHWRSSTNQRILCLTDRYSEAELAAEQSRAGVTLTIRGHGPTIVSGLQSRAAAADVEVLLRSADWADTPEAS